MYCIWFKHSSGKIICRTHSIRTVWQTSRIQIKQIADYEIVEMLLKKYINNNNNNLKYEWDVYI